MDVLGASIFFRLGGGAYCALSDELVEGNGRWLVSVAMSLLLPAALVNNREIRLVLVLHILVRNSCVSGAHTLPQPDVDTAVVESSSPGVAERCPAIIWAARVARRRRRGGAGPACRTAGPVMACVSMATGTGDSATVASSSSIRSSLTTAPRLLTWMISAWASAAAASRWRPRWRRRPCDRTAR